MRTPHRNHYVAALLFAGYGGSACSSQCDIDSSLCQSRKIVLRNDVIDKTTSQLSIQILGGLLPSPKFARLLAPVKAGVSTPALVDMEAMPGAAEGDYTIDLKDNLAKLLPGCSYYLDVFQTEPAYQVVDDICNYKVSVVSNKSPWIKNSTISDVTDVSGLWLYGGNYLILKQAYSYLETYNNFSRYLTYSYDDAGRFSALDKKMEFLSLNNFAYFKNSQGILANYALDAPNSPKLYRPTMAGSSFMPNHPISEIQNFGEFSDIAADSAFTFFVAAPTIGELVVANMPAIAMAKGPLTRRDVLNGKKDGIRKIAIIKQNTDALVDFIAFDQAGNPQVFLQQTNQKFAYDQDLTTARKDLGTGEISALAVGDIDGDGRDDLAIVRASVGADTVRFYLGQTNGSFQLDAATVTHGKTITSIAIGAVARLPGARFNNLVVLDNTSTVSVYQHAAPEVCSFTPVPCSSSPAIENRPIKR